MSQNNSFQSVGDNAHYYIAGFGLYYLLWFALSFYPAFIIGLQVMQSTPPDEDPDAAFLTAALLTIIFIIVLLWFRQFVPVVGIYLVCLWPLIHQIIHWWNVGHNEDYFPLPPVDWWPFW